MQSSLIPMPTLKAVVSGGRAIIEDVGDYPDGTELEVEIIANDEMSEESRTRLHASLERGLAQMAAGETVSGEEVIASLRARGR